MTTHASHPGNSAPVLEFLAHAAVRIRAGDGTRLLIDPYHSGGFGGKIAYAPIDEAADYVFATHEHADHRAFEDVPGDPVVIEEEGRFGPFELRTWTLAHDEYRGRRRGGLVDVSRVEVDGVEIVHLSDVGQSPPGRVPTSFRRPDVLLATCGGFYTVGAAQAWEWSERIAARVTIPIHYKTPGCRLPIRSRTNAESHWRSVRERSDYRIELGSELFSFQRVMMPLEQLH